MEEINTSGIQKTVEKEQIKRIKKKFLTNKSIAISVSENEDLEKLGFTIQHLNDITIEIARYIIANDGKALYGGDLRQNGFTTLFSELSNQYKRMDDETSGFVNYFVFPNTKGLTQGTRIHFLSKNIEINEVIPPKGLNIDYNISYNPKTNFEHRYIYSECFKEMRIQMAKDCTARIIVGGKIKNYLGYIPGVIEEALYTLKDNKPLYLVGAFGGATERLIKLIKGEKVKELTNDFQYDTSFLSEFKDYVSSKCDYTDYDVLKAELSKFDVKNLSELNGLSEEENEVLFTSKNIHQIMYLLMKGLNKFKV
ncbi:hypothetical protein [Myroides odoratus]|uniref:Uncharacterized protein n=1 Tax=Myroides odoratus TaxID=256 RepID=A0A9Q6Z6V9_MYROD|nr:hypothetical protein [Myroides odoratus]EHQ43936.1 hypothetical protein Myrod_3120 [Myroides odoratus DSM 2801]EKB04947.1 hypothetical protein HMPREF9716_02978 [Myroides odoratus CIP 103059]QQU01237.1 hypothetical protein I6I88_05660 [Myroides odoratus]WQD56505.1 hypothetical protein U0010_13370 [Myroides odoratus]STZ31212.1 Uncharacterised protein [Myroides odoratus]